MKLLMSAAALLVGSCLIAAPDAEAQSKNQQVLRGKESTATYLIAAPSAETQNKNNGVLRGKESTPAFLRAAPSAEAQNTNPDVLRGKESTPIYMTLSGDVTANGKAFVSGRHEKVWTITNPDALREYAGQSVTFLGTADPETGGVTAVWIDGQFVGQTGTGNREF